GSSPRGSWAPDRACGHTEQEWQAMIDAIEMGWGEARSPDLRAPSAADNQSYRQWWATYQRLAASPGPAVRVMQMNKEIAVRAHPPRRPRTDPRAPSGSGSDDQRRAGPLPGRTHRGSEVGRARGGGPRAMGRGYRHPPGRGRGIPDGSETRARVGPHS